MPSNLGEDQQPPLSAGWKPIGVAQVSHPPENKERLCEDPDITAATASTRIETQIYASYHSPAGSQNQTLLLK